MFCTECGKENRNDRKFCENCGSPLHDYTKPKENLIYRENIKMEKDKVRRKNIVKFAFDIALISLVGLLIVCIALSFIFKGDAKNALIIVAISIFLIYLLTGIAQQIVVRTMIRKITKSSSKNESTQNKKSAKR